MKPERAPETVKIGKLRVCSSPIEARLEQVSQAKTVTVSFATSFGIVLALSGLLAFIKLAVLTPEPLSTALTPPMDITSVQSEQTSPQETPRHLDKPEGIPPKPPEVQPVPDVVPPPALILPPQMIALGTPDVANVLEEMERTKELEEAERQRIEQEKLELAKKKQERLKREQQLAEQREREAKEARERAAEAKRKSEIAKKNEEERRKTALAKKVIKNPSLTRRVPPSYPRSARTSGYEGTTRIMATITSSGKVSSPRVVKSSGHRSLDSAALAAVKKWHFTPAKNGIGQSIAHQIMIPVSFRLN